MDGVLIINDVADTVARDIKNIAAMPEIEGGEWMEAPSGTVFAGYRYEGGKFIPPSRPLPTDDDVNAERARRITEGTTVNVTGVGAMPVAGREEDTRNLQGLVTAAQLRLASGDTTTAINFRDDANNMHALTPSQVVELWEKAEGYISAVYAASWTLKDGTIPADYADDRHWP